MGSYRIFRSKMIGGKQSLVTREFGLGVESRERFVHHELRRPVHERAFGVLPLRSEPIDPRL
jgi:hypothetical protein